MNEHLKLAYDHGVQQAIIDAGLTKESGLGSIMSRKGSLVRAGGKLPGTAAAAEAARLEKAKARMLKNFNQQTKRKSPAYTATSTPQAMRGNPVKTSGLTKEAVIGADATYGDLIGKNTPESRQLSRTLHGGLGAGIGGIAGAGLGGMGAAGLANLLTRGRVRPKMLEALGTAGATAGGIGGMYTGGLQGTELSMENDPALMRYLRAARRNLGLE